MRSMRLALAAILFCAGLGSAAADIVYVNGDVAASGDGSSWAQGYKTVTEGIAASQVGDEIWVKTGIYPEPSYLTPKNNVALYGGFAGSESPPFDLDTRNFLTNETVIDAAGAAQAMRLVARSGTVVDGFTLRNGSATLIGLGFDRGGALYVENLDTSNAVRNLVIEDNFAELGGGGLYVKNSTLTFETIDIRNNRCAPGGGGLGVEGGAPRFVNCLIAENRSNTSGGGLAVLDGAAPVFVNCSILNNRSLLDGGGLYVEDAFPRFENSVLANNQSVLLGGGAMLVGNSSSALVQCAVLDNQTTTSVFSNDIDGGGFYLTDSAGLELTSVTLAGNFARKRGGAIFAGASAHVITDGVRFEENQAGPNADAALGGAVYVGENASIRSVNSIYWKNDADGQGMAIALETNPSAATSILSQLSVVDNASPGASGTPAALFSANPSAATVVNSIFWGNGDDLLGPQPLYSDIENGDPGTGNFSLDPLFRDRAAGDLRLGAGSPCIDSGTDTSIAAYGAVNTDIEGDLRPQGPGYDVGADEYRVESFRFLLASASIGEADGPLDIEVELNASSAIAASVEYWLFDLDATQGLDYAPSSGTLNFNPSSSIASFPVSILDDFLIEGDERFEIALRNPSIGAIALPSTMTVTIVDDDGIFFDTNTRSVAESVGATDILVNLSPPAPPGGTTLTLVVSGDATHGAGQDYTFGGTNLTFDPPSGRLDLYFNPSSAQEAIRVLVNDDLLVEPTETLDFNMSSTVNGPPPLPPETFRLSILDNDSAPSDPDLYFAASASGYSESAGSGSVRVRLDPVGGGSGGQAAFRVSGTATYGAGADYTIQPSALVSFNPGPMRGTLSWNPSSTDVYIDLLFNNDTQPEDTETIVFDLEPNPSNANLIAPTRHVLSLFDDDSLELVSPTPGGGRSFGHVVLGLEDLSGDGSGDIAVGAYSESVTRGRVHLYNGFDQALIQSLDSPQPQDNGQFGRALAWVEPFALPQAVLAVGAPGESPGASDEFAGRVHLFEYNGASLLWRLSLESPQDQISGEFGWSVCAMPGGLVAVGAPGEDSQAGEKTDTGRAYIFNAEDGSLVAELASPLSSQRNDGNFGAALAWWDGPQVLAVGAPGEGENDAGWVHLFTAQGQPVGAIWSPNSATVFGQFGNALAPVGDVNADGFEDLAVGAFGEDDGSSPLSAGRVYVFSGDRARGLPVLHSLASPEPQAFGFFGDAVAGILDSNSNGRPDIAVGAELETAPGTPYLAGRCFVFDGGAGDLIGEFVSPNALQEGRFGSSVSGLPVEATGDGRNDFVVGAIGEIPDGQTARTGRCYLFSAELIFVTPPPPDLRPARAGHWPLYR